MWRAAASEAMRMERAARVSAIAEDVPMRDPFIGVTPFFFAN